MKRKYFLAIQIVAALASCVQSRMNETIILGRWSLLNKEHLFSNNYYHRQILRPNVDFFDFDSDSVNIESGIYCLRVERHPEGYYPYIYQGNRTKYVVRNDTLLIWHQGYGLWCRYRMVFTDSLLKLTGDLDTLEFAKSSRNISPNEEMAEIEEVRINVFDPEHYLVNYSNHLTSDGLLEHIDYFGDTSAFNWSAGKRWFMSSTLGLYDVDTHNLKPLYESLGSEGPIIDLFIDYNDGTVAKTRIIGSDSNQDLLLALTPIIYAHHKFLYQNINCENLSLRR